MLGQIILFSSHDGFQGIVILQRIGIIVLALLAMAEWPLQAQSGNDLKFGSPESSVRSDLRDDTTPRMSNSGLSLAIPPLSIAHPLGGTGSGTEVATETLSFSPSHFSRSLCRKAPACDFSSSSGASPQPHAHDPHPGEDPTAPPGKAEENPKTVDFNRGIYYKNKLEFSLDGGWLPINIPWPFDVFNGDAYDVTGVNYTLVPIFASLRWHMNDVGGPGILRGNWDCTFTASATAIPRGPETRYFAYIMGFRRNFVRPRWRAVPYFNILGGLGQIDAKGPEGVYGAQGQNFTFTFNLGSGVRYNFNPRYAISAGINYMHISNFYLSQPKFINYGINVYGPMFGIDMQLRPHRRHSE